MAEYYKHEIARWNVATDDLTLEQEAAYHRVVSQIRLYERPFRENYRVLSGLWRCNERRAKRLLAELVAAGKLVVDGGFIIDEKAVNDASTLRQSRVDKQLAGRRGGVESGKSRLKSLEDKETGEAPASTREEKRREEKSIGGGGGSAGAREADHPADPDPTIRERILSAMGLGPDGVAGPSKFVGSQGDMAEAARWLALPGLTEEAVIAEVARLSAAKADGPAHSFRYFTPAMQRLSAAMTAPPLQAAPPPPARASPRPGQPDLAAAIARLEAQGRI